jgi:hypothetical protein
MTNPWLFCVRTTNYGKVNTTTELKNSGTHAASLFVGSTEQFGPYVPIHIDSLIAELHANGKAANALIWIGLGLGSGSRRSNPAFRLIRCKTSLQKQLSQNPPLIRCKTSLEVKKTRKFT